MRSHLTSKFRKEMIKVGGGAKGGPLITKSPTFLGPNHQITNFFWPKSPSPIFALFS